jgi:hypothetical protein
MNKTLGSVKRRLGGSALVFAAVSTILFAGAQVLMAARRGIPPVEAAVREWPPWVFFFSWMFLWWRLVEQYRHEPRPRTRFVLKRIGWAVILAAALVLLLELQHWAAFS